MYAREIATRLVALVNADKDRIGSEKSKIRKYAKCSKDREGEENRRGDFCEEREQNVSWTRHENKPFSQTSSDRFEFQSDVLHFTLWRVIHERRRIRVPRFGTYKQYGHL